jgi:hypothetical protein
VTELLVALLSVPAPEAGEIDQVTPVCAGSYCTVAVSTCVPPATTVAVLGDIDTTLAGTVRVAVADVDLLEREVAAIVTTKSLGGGLAGAV